jgi:hypothetical protein
MDGTIVSVEIVNSSTTPLTNIPITFGQVFRAGDVAAGATPTARIGADGVPLQVDAKATHADGSLRHAVLTAIIPSLGAMASAKLELVSSAASSSDGSLAASDLLATGFDVTAELTIAGATYRASAAELLANDSSHTWLRGHLVTEWEVSAPFSGTAGPHPHLAARLAIRAYRGFDLVRAEVTVENDWAFEPNPQGYAYDVRIATGATTTYSRQGLAHANKARWNKAFWIGGTPSVSIRHDPAYLVATGVVPNYAPNLTIAESALSAMAADWSGAKTEPMGSGAMNPHMPDTGGRPDIGILPGWAAAYAISMDPRAKEVTLGSGDAAGSFACIIGIRPPISRCPSTTTRISRFSATRPIRRIHSRAAPLNARHRSSTTPPTSPPWRSCRMWSPEIASTWTSSSSGPTSTCFRPIPLTGKSRKGSSSGTRSEDKPGRCAPSARWRSSRQTPTR